MTKEITHTSVFTKDFTVIEGSNYKIVMSFGYEEVVAFEQFKSIANSIFREQATFITINNTIIQTKDIRMITPTSTPTLAQKERIEQERKKYFQEKEEYKKNKATREKLGYKQFLEKHNMNNLK